MEFNNANSSFFKQNRVVTYEVKAKGGVDGLDAPYQPKNTAEIAYVGMCQHWSLMVQTAQVAGVGTALGTSS